MGTGGSSLPSSPDELGLHGTLKTKLCYDNQELFLVRFLSFLRASWTFALQMLQLTLDHAHLALRANVCVIYVLLRKTFDRLDWFRMMSHFALQNAWSSLRAISTGQLHALLHFHLRPINHVVSMGPYLWGNLILKGASRLDAFSVYPVRT